MTYADDLDSDSHDRAFYAAFAGVERRFATHDLTGIVGGTYSVGLLDTSISGGDRTLDLEHGIVTDGGLSFSITDGDDARNTFRRRGGVETSISAVLTSSGTTVTLGSATATWANGTTVYLGRETIILGTHTGIGVYTGSTRGAHGSSATSHAISEVVSDVPRHWFSRRCTLYEVNRSTGTESALWFGSLSENPTWSPGLRMFAATSRMDEWMTRPICSGFRDYHVNMATKIVTLTSGKISFVFDNAAEEYEFAANANGAWLRVDVDGMIGFFFFESTDLTGSGLTIDVARQLLNNQGEFSTSLGITTFQNAAKISVRQVELVNGPLAAQALAVIRSRIGGSSFDVLPGRDSDAAGAALASFYRRRMGAGIPSGEVDVASWQALVGGTTTELDPLFEEERLGSYLERLLWRCGAYAIQDSTGKLSANKYDGVAIRASVTTYNAETQLLLADVTATDVENDVPGGATIKGSYDVFDEEYKRSIDILWFDDADIYGDKDSKFNYQSKSVKIGDGSASWTILEQSLDRVRARRLYAGRRTSYRVEWRHRLVFLPGQRVAITDARLDDGEGGVGVTARPYEVTRYTPDWVNGYITVELDELYTSSVLAPSAVIASNPATGANPTIILSGSFTDDDGSPALDFPIGCTIEIRDASDGYLTTTTLIVTGAPSGTSITTSGTPGFAIRLNDLIEMKVSGDVGATNDVGADVEDFAFAADSTLLIDSGARSGPRWG